MMMMMMLSSTNTYWSPSEGTIPACNILCRNDLYDENQFFSSQMLLGRGDSPDYVWTDLMPAYQAYVQSHLDLVKKSLKATKPPSKKLALFFHQNNRVLKHQKAYDDYSSVRDPVHGLLVTTFGKEYADDFVYDVLFPLPDRPPSL
jgi:15,16-dihydrobiliverdin:ferredoxin oxidoreductase